MKSLSFSLPPALYTALIGWKCSECSEEGLPAAEQISYEHFCPRVCCSGVHKGTAGRVHPNRKIWERAGAPQKNSWMLKKFRP